MNWFANNAGRFMWIALVTPSIGTQPPLWEAQYRRTYWQFSGRDPGTNTGLVEIAIAHAPPHVRRAWRKANS